MITEPTPLTILLNRYNQLLTIPYERNPYFKTEYEYKKQIKDKVEELKKIIVKKY